MRNSPDRYPTAKVEPLGHPSRLPTPRPAAPLRLSTLCRRLNSARSSGVQGTPSGSVSPQSSFDTCPPIASSSTQPRRLSGRMGRASCTVRPAKTIDIALALKVRTARTWSHGQQQPPHRHRRRRRRTRSHQRVGGFRERRGRSVPRRCEKTTMRPAPPRHMTTKHAQ
jgi:hypothetical protein